MKKNKTKKEANMLETLCKATFYFVITLIIIGVVYFRMTLQWGDGLLSYAGAIIGGGLTLIGVAITIYYQDVRRKEELELMYQPILSANIVEFKKINKLANELTLSFNHQGFDDTRLDSAPYMIEFTNTGRGEIKEHHYQIANITIINSPFTNENQLDLSKSYILADGMFNFFPVNSSNYMLINIPKQSLMYSDSNLIRIGVTLDINVSGFIGEEVHEYRLTFYIDIPLNNTIEEINMDSLTISYIGKKKKERLTKSVG